MSQIEKQVNSLVLGYFSKIDSNIIEKNGLFDITIPEKYFKIFQTNKLKIVFDSKLSKPNDYELVSPGSNILFKILNECLDFGPVITAKLNPNKKNSRKIRFYFYSIFESIISQTELIHVDIDMNNKKIITINNSDIDFNETSFDSQIQEGVIDDCYVESITHIEQNLMKTKINDFKSQIFNMKQEELENINSEYKKRNKEIQEKYVILRSKGESGKNLEKIIDETEIIKNEEENIRKNIDNKYAIVIDFALVSSLILT
jgi:hypothetical protein